MSEEEREYLNETIRNLNNQLVDALRERDEARRLCVHSDDLYKIAKTMEGLFKKINALDNKISSRDISGRDIEEALSDISYKMGDAFDTLKTILIQNEIVSGPSDPLTLPKKA